MVMGPYSCKSQIEIVTEQSVAIYIYVCVCTTKLKLYLCAF